MKYWELDTPSLLIDREILMENLRNMQAYADRQGVALRPHTKTHKMPQIAKWQEELGAQGIAVAKVGEAEVMAAHGLSDIFIANEIVGRPKLARIAALARNIQISFGVDSVYQIQEAEAVFSESGQTAEVLIEVEVGERRCGVDRDEDCPPLLDAIEASPHVHLRGFFGHDGNTYGAETVAACRKIAIEAQKKLVRFAKLARRRGLEAPVVSYGSTPPLVRQVEIVEGITELRPGTYALMDVSQGNALGTLNTCAASVLATVISTPNDQRVVLDVGAKGLTMQERTKGICNSRGKGVFLEHPEASIDRIFDEHAIVEDPALRRQVTVGQKLRILPVHICPVCNLYDRAYLLSGDQVVQELEISARGKLQ